MADSNNHNIGDFFNGPGIPGKYTREAGMLGYNEICEMHTTRGWNIVFDKEQRVPYCYSGNQWIGYDDIR